MHWHSQSALENTYALPGCKAKQSMGSQGEGRTTHLQQSASKVVPDGQFAVAEVSLHTHSQAIGSQVVFGSVQSFSKQPTSMIQMQLTGSQKLGGRQLAPLLMHTHPQLIGSQY